MANAYELAIAAARQTVEMAHRDMHEDYALGFNAWYRWIEWLDLVDPNDGQFERSSSLMGNHWIYTTLIEYRTIAAAYLNSTADQFPEAGTMPHLRKTAKV